MNTIKVYFINLHRKVIIIYNTTGNFDLQYFSYIQNLQIPLMKSRVGNRLFFIGTRYDINAIICSNHT